MVGNVWEWPILQLSTVDPYGSGGKIVHARMAWSRPRWLYTGTAIYDNNERHRGGGGGGQALRRNAAGRWKRRTLSSAGGRDFECLKCGML